MMKKFYFFIAMILCSAGVWAQQVIGSFPQMRGGFEGQTSILLNGSITANGVETTIDWTTSATTNVTSTISLTGGRSGPTYATYGTTAAAAVRLQSPTVTTSGAIANTTAYTMQFYYRTAGATAPTNYQRNISPDGTSSPGTYNALALTGTSGVWTFVQVSQTSGTSASATRYGIGIIRANGASTANIDIDDFVMYAGAADNTAANSPGTVTVNNPTNTSLDVSWLAASGGVDGGGYVVVRYAALPGATDDPLQNGIYAVGNTVPGGVNGTVAYIGTGLNFTDIGLATGTTYYYKVYTVDKAFNYSVESEGNGATTAAVPDIALSSLNPAVIAGNITQGTNNNVIYRFDLAVTTADATLNGVTINTAGTYAATDITNLKCWYSSDNIFNSGSDVLLSTNPAVTTAGAQVFPTFANQTIINGTTGYFFITADIPCTAVTGNDISVNAITTADISFVAGNKTGTAFAGGLQTIIAAIPNDVTTPAASVANASSSISWTAPAGCYDDVLIVAATASNTWIPIGTTYPSSLTYGAGTPLGNGFAVYQGTASPQLVNGLTNGTPYFYKIFTRFGSTWSAGVEVNATPAIVTLATDYFRSKNTGDWNLTATWESSSDNVSWMDATITPDENANTITIRNTHIVTVALPVTADQLVIEPTATLTLAAIFTVADGAAATDMSVDGTVINALVLGNHIVTGTIVFNAGSLYQHARDGGIVIPATWATTSTAEIIGIITSTTLNCGNQTFGNFTWNSIGQIVNLNLTGTLATINGNFLVQNSGTVSLRMTGSANLNLVVGGNYTVEANHNLDNSASGTTTVSIAGNFAHTGGTFESSAAVVPITMTGIGRTFTQSGGIFNNANLNWIINTGAEITLNNNLPLATSRTLTIDGILNCGVLAVNGTGAITVNNGGRARVGSLSASGAVEDNLSASGGLTLNTGSTIEFNGLAAQFAGARTFSNLEFNNASGATLIGAVVVNNILGLTSGIVTTSAVNLLTMSSGSSYTGGNTNTNFIYGPIKKIGMTGFIFPVGKQNGLVPIEISNFFGGTAADEFTAEYIRSSARALGPATAPGLFRVSACDYWTLVKGIATPTSLDITAYWNANSPCWGDPYVTNPSTITIAHLENVPPNEWTTYALPAVVTGGSTNTAGSVTWQGATAFGPLSLGSTEFAANPLPISINYFNGTKQNGNHLLNWKVTCINTPGATLEIERSTNGNSYSSIYSVYASALRCQQPFDFTDMAPAKGTNYYRLKMTDVDGKISYSHIVPLINAAKGMEMMNIAPNPIVNGSFNVKVSSAENMQMQMMITDMQGRVLQKINANLVAGFNTIPVTVRQLAAGTYQLYGNTADGRTRVLRFVIQ